MSQEKEIISFDRFVQEKWFGENSKRTIWVSAYRAVGVKENLKELITIKGDKSTIAFLYGSLKYLNVDFTEVKWENQRPLINTDSGFKETEEGNWVLIISPFEENEKHRNTTSIESLISLHAGLIASIFGTNTVHEKVFDNTIDLNSGKKQAFSKAYKNPYVNPSPAFSEENLNLLEQALNNISALPEKDQNRFSLALNWYFDAINDSGKEGFIKSWIAIEILQMPNTTNIKPIKDALSKIYGIAIETVDQKFKIGKLFGLRSRIVHSGENVGLHYLVEAFLQSVFVDILFWKLDLPVEKKASKILEIDDFNLESYL